ncbi:MAG: GNAT family N-acetyltransferase [Solirubrobacterales bacterium]|nr:GNAT family N-acetyltransferase [Solirubrobacterales bacterium]
MILTTQLSTERLVLNPLPPAAAAALPDDRQGASRIIGAKLSSHWPASDLLDVLPMQAAAGPEQARYGVWVIIERESGVVVGDIGFLGPPGPEEEVEVGYSIVPDRRRRGYATEAARALVAWAREQPGVRVFVAECDEHNQASVQTLERLGFSRTAKAGGRLRWRLGRDDRADRQPATPDQLR